VALADPNVSVSAGRFVGHPDREGRWPFRVEADVRGPTHSIELLRVRMPDTATRPPLDQPLIIAHSATRSAAMKARKVVTDESVRAVLSLEGVPAAIFPWTARWEAVLSEAPLQPSSGRGYRAALFGALRDTDPSWATIWTGELAVRMASLAPFDHTELADIAHVLDRQDVSVAARAALMTTSLDHRPDSGQAYIANAAAVLSRTSVPPSATETPLLLAALQVAQAHPDRIEAPLVEPWLLSTPILAERAALALRARSPDLELAAIDRALASLPPEAELARFLHDHRERMLRQR
jgi:hypothetical protein